MGALDLWLNSKRRRTGSLADAVFGTQTITEPGDPDFGLAKTPDSQAQFPAAAAQQRVFDVQRRAQNILLQAQAAGVDTSIPEYDPIRQAAEKGFIQRALTVGERLIGWLDGPRQMINLLMQDVAGGTAERGLRDPNVLDYLDAFFGGIEDKDQFLEETGLNPVSGSPTLELFGWEEADTLPGKVVRGIADFGLQVLADPITYLTLGYGGIAKRAILSKGLEAGADIGSQVLRIVKSDFAPELMEQAPRYVRRLAKDVDRVASDFIDDFKRVVEKGNLTDENFRSFNKLFARLAGDIRKGTDKVEDLRDVLIVAGVQSRVAKDGIKPLLRKQFHMIDKDLREILPLYMQGGLRFSIPFTEAGLKRGVTVPGTTGLFSKYARPRIEAVSAALQSRSRRFNNLASNLRSIRNSLDQDRAKLLALADDKLEGWQTVLAGWFIDDLSRLPRKQYIKAQVNAARRGLEEQLGELAPEILESIDPNTILSATLEGASETASASLGQLGPTGRLMREITDKMPPGPKRDELIVQAGALGADLDRLVQFMRDRYDEYFDVLSKFNPQVADLYRKNYMPHVLTEDAGRVLNRLATHSAAINMNEIGDDPAKQLYAIVLNRLSRGGRLESQLGASRFMDELTIGHTQAVTLTDDGAMLFDFTHEKNAQLIERLLRRGYVNEKELKRMMGEKVVLPVRKLNELLEPVIREQAEKFNIPLPRKWDGKVFNDNAFDVLESYLDNLDGVVRAWNQIDVLKAAGLAVRHDTAIDAQKYVENMVKNIAANSETVVKQTPEGVKSLRRLKGWEKLQPEFDLEDARALRRLGFDISGKKQKTALARAHNIYKFINEDMAAVEKRIMQADEKADVFGNVKRSLGRAGHKRKTLADQWAAHTIDKVKYMIHRNEQGIVDAIVGVKGKTLSTLTLAEGTDETVRRFIPRMLRDEGVQFSRTGLLNVTRSGQVNTAGWNNLRSALKRAYAALPPETLEKISKSPAEYEAFRLMYEESVERPIMEAFADIAVARTKEDVLVPEGNIPFTFNRGSEVAERLKEIRKAAIQLSDETGWKEVSRIFRGTFQAKGLAGKEGFVNPGIFALGGPALEGLQVDADLAVWLRQVAQNYAVMFTPEGIGALKMANNSILRAWRGLATVARPSFHIRNHLSATLNNMIIGVGPEDYKRVGVNALKLRKKLAEGLDFEDAVKFLDENIQDAFMKAWDEEVLFGFVTSEFRGIRGVSTKKDVLSFMNVLDPDKFIATRAGSRVMESIEDFHRMAAFVKHYDPARPWTAKTARDMVEAVHFNYQRLTPWETRIKSVVPFFVWTRRNLPLQMRLLVERPRFITRYRAMMQAIDDQFGDVDDSGLPLGDQFTAFAAGTGFAVNKGTPFWARVILDPDLPVRDLVELQIPFTPEGLEMITDMVGPAFTLPFDILTQREYTDVNAPAGMDKVLKTLAHFGFYDTTTSGDVRIPYFLRTVAETALPFTREVVAPLAGGPTDPRRQQRAGVAEDDTALEASLRTLLNVFGKGLGVKFDTPVDIRGAAGRSSRELEKLVEDLRLRGIQPPSTG